MQATDRELEHHDKPLEYNGVEVRNLDDLKKHISLGGKEALEKLEKRQF